jgi:hypothetical protein
MVSRSLSPDLGLSSDEDSAEECTKVEHATTLKQKVWSWLHIAVSTGNIDKVICQYVPSISISRGFRGLTLTIQVKECIDGVWRYPPNGCKPVMDVDQLDCVRRNPNHASSFIHLCFRNRGRR